MAPAALFNQASSKTVCVMDASGRLGSTLVKRLLQRGYTVHAAVQNHGEIQWSMDDEEVSLTLCSGYAYGENKNKKKRLRVFNSDPLDYHSILDALKGCCGLFYSFEPPSDHPVYDEYMGELEVRAAHNVVEACAQTETLEKVVFTSSVTAIIWKDSRNSFPCDFDERTWSDISFCRKFKLWHGLSKTVAEKAAWALAMDRGVNMVSINGGLLMGGGSDLSITNPYLKGAAEMYEDGVFVTVDLQFMVDAHICVFEDVSSYGRYLCFNHVINSDKDALKLAHMLLPPSSPALSLEDKRVVYKQRISNKKLDKLMVDF